MVQALAAAHVAGDFLARALSSRHVAGEIIDHRRRVITEIKIIVVRSAPGSSSCAMKRSSTESIGAGFFSRTAGAITAVNGGSLDIVQVKPVTRETGDRAQ